MKKFSIKEAVSFGFGVAKKNILFFLGVFVISILISGIGNSFQEALKEAAFFSVLASFVIWVISSLLTWDIKN